MRHLSKSKLINFRQCPKRLWLQTCRPELATDSQDTQAGFQVGDRVGEVARGLYDPEGIGALVNREGPAFEAAFPRTQVLLQDRRPIFEAGFRAEGAQAFADVMLPMKGRGQRWRMVEVKSAANLKDYHCDDVAIQSFVIRAAGVPLAGVAVAHVDSSWTYPGDGDYQGLLVEQDLTKEVQGREKEVRGWITGAQAIVRRKSEPNIRTGDHCTSPYKCPFLHYCQQQEPQARQPLDWLPDVRAKRLKEYVVAHPAGELGNVPDDLLNDRQKRVKDVTLSGRPFFDAAGTAQALRAHKPPAYFMDFETIWFAVPLWKGTRPYQMIPFQFSVHRLGARGAVSHEPFLDLSGNDPSKAFVEALIRSCGDAGPVFVYNAAFEGSRLADLAERFPRLAGRLNGIRSRIVDLWPVAKAHFYHPDQHGSWSIKDVLPAACPDLHYSDLDGVQNGDMAMSAYLEAVAPGTPGERKAQLEHQLLAYCKLDTWAMVRLWALFTDRSLT